MFDSAYKPSILGRTNVGVVRLAARITLWAYDKARRDGDELRLMLRFVFLGLGQIMVLDGTLTDITNFFLSSSILLLSSLVALILMLYLAVAKMRVLLKRAKGQ